MKNTDLKSNVLTNKQRSTILLTIMTGAFITVLAQTVLTSALPSIMSDFNVSANTGQWLTTIYMLVLGVMIPATPYLINRFSTRILFIASMIFFVTGCGLSIIAKSFSIMVISRILQAICGGITTQLVQILIMRMYPIEERGSAMGMYGFVVGVAPTVGPIAAGVIIDSLGWRALFYILGAITLIDIILAYIFLQNVGETKEDKLDIKSLILSTIGFGGLLVGISNKGSYGWSNPLAYAPLVAGIISLIVFTIRELKIKEPLLNLRTFKSKNFTISVILIVIVYAGMTSSSTMFSLYMQSIREYSALKTGLLMLPGSILMAILSPISGKLFDKYGPSKVIIPGFVFLLLGTVTYSFLGENTSLIYLSVTYSLRMVGIAFLLMTVTTWGINSLKSDDISSGSAISSTLRQVSGSIGSAILMTIMSSVSLQNVSTMSSKMADIKGMNISFLIASVIVFIGLILSLIFVKSNKNNNNKLNKKLA